VAAVGFRVIPIHQFHEYAFGRVPVDLLSSAWFMSVLHLYQRTYSRLSKRAFDLVILTVALPVLALLVPLMALLVRLSSAGPVLFRQIRVGEHGEPFQMIKFRTMVDGAEAPGRAVWAGEGDPRITPIGRLMRRMRLDELPQLWNVLCGDMSIVGPRPERPEFLELLEDEVPFWSRRHLVKPGLTGWAQVRHPYTADVAGAAEKLSYDLYYLKHRSLRLDLAIVAMTAATVAGGFGSR
jgi:lipopolysaccharide/colanic/teichoic acid biosynthesis glycosyltransferase